MGELRFDRQVVFCCVTCIEWRDLLEFHELRFTAVTYIDDNVAILTFKILLFVHQNVHQNICWAE